MALTCNPIRPRSFVASGEHDGYLHGISPLFALYWGSMTSMNDRKRRQCVIIGAGPAGLTAAYELSEMGGDPIVLEQDRVVGGIARTVEHRGYRFDIGGHRFFSKVPLINEWWKNILGDDFQPRSRLSRIYYNGAFFDYPLRPTKCVTRPRPCRNGAHRGELRPGSNFSHAHREKLRGMGLQQVWPAVVRDLLQDLYRKSVGYELQRYRSRLGLAAHKEFGSGGGREGHVPGQQRGDHNSHSTVSLSSPRARHDVGASDRDP